MENYESIDQYIENFPEETRVIIERVRAVINEAASGAHEKISYGIPTLVLNGNLVHFAAYKHHIGFYPGPSAIEEFKKLLSAYEVSTGTIKFPIDQPIPFNLITSIVLFRVEENLKK